MCPRRGFLSEVRHYSWGMLASLASILLISPGEGALVVGRVVGPEGEALVARVGLVECPESFSTVERSIAIGTTDSAGQVRLAIAPEWFAQHDHAEFAGLVAWAPGMGIVAERTRLSEVGFRGDFELRCAAPRSSRFRIEDDAGPVRGARTWVAAVALDNGDVVRLPAEFWRGAEALSDADGWFQLPEASARIAAVGIHAPGSLPLLLHRHWSSASPLPETLQLPSAVVGEVLVDITLPEGSTLSSECELQRGDDESGKWVVRSRATVGSSGTGRFVLPLVPKASRVTVATEDASALVLGEAQTERSSGNLRISRSAQVRVRGRVVDARSRAPLAGVRLVIRAAHQGVALTSADGSFEFECGSTKFAFLAIDAPAGHVDLALEAAEFDAGARDVLDLGEFALPSAAELVGQVVTYDGGPEPDAWLVAEQVMRLGSLRGSTRSTTVADAEGRYTFPQLAQDTEVRLAGSSAGRLGGAKGLPNELAKFRVLDSLRGRGRVLGSDGAPVAGLEIELWKARDRQFPDGADLVSFGSVSSFTTNERGEFTSPVGLAPEATYSLRWLSPEFEGRRSAWFSGADLERGVDIGLEGTLRLRGRLVDAEGKPLVGVAVRTRDGGSKAITDERGEYLLESVSPRGELVVACAAKGIRHVRWAEPGEVATDWRIDATHGSESPLAPAPPLDREHELDLARALLSESLAEAETSGDDGRLRSALLAWSRVDLVDALARLESASFGSGAVRDSTRLGIATWLAAYSPTESLAMLHGASASPSRTSRRIETALLLEGEKKHEQIALARAEARALPSPEGRIHALGLVAAALHESGDDQAAREILPELRELVARMPVDPSTTGIRAGYLATLARLEPAEACRAARALTEPAARSIASFWVARALAASEPALAQELLDSEADTLDPNSPMDHAPTVVFRMARLDLQRARAIAERHDPTGASDAWIAYAIATHDPAEAKLSLAKAFERARKLEGVPMVGYRIHSPLQTAASLLTIAEAVDPGGMRDYVQELLALAPIARREVFSASSYAASCDAVIAFHVARWDRALARKLLDPFVEELRRDAPSAALRAEHEFWAATAVVDPDWAAGLAREFGGNARQIIGLVLAVPPEQRATYVQREFLGLTHPSQGWR